MKKTKKTIAQRILFNRDAYRSKIISEEILRVAKEMAEKSHQAAIAAKKAYIAQHKRTRAAQSKQYD